MSVKAMALVWDLECPKDYGEVIFKPSHKYTLVAYADHADHQGKNIWPAVATVAKKTGLDERTVQRLTGDLEAIGLLIEDGQGPHGTNKWRMPFNEGGDKLSPLTKRRSDKNENSLGDIPSGDIPSGDKLTPESNEPEPSLIEEEEQPFEKAWRSVLDQVESQTPRASFQNYVRETRAVRFHGNALTIQAANADAREWLEDRLTSTVERLLVGIMNQSVSVEFVVAAMESPDA